MAPNHVQIDNLVARAHRYSAQAAGEVPRELRSLLLLMADAYEREAARLTYERYVETLDPRRPGGKSSG